MRFPASLLSLAGMLVSTGLFGPLARAQDDWDVGQKAVDRPNQQMRFALPDFDQWVLGRKTRDQIERDVKSQLALRVESADRACELSAAQREKLQLAGEGDLIRLWRTIDQLRARFHEAVQDQQTYSNLISEGSMLQIKLHSAVYDDSSLFQKALRQTLSREQSARYDQQDRERRKFHYEAKIELVLSNLEDTIPLRAEQRQRLVKLLVEETEPPKKFGQYVYYVVIFQAGKLDEAKLSPILDDAQRQSLKKLCDQYRGMEPFLKQQGYVP
jgi:hypothetical protein